MRIAHITTSTVGGAGIAAMRQVDALQEIGVNAELLSQRKGTGRTTLDSKLLTLFQAKIVQSEEDLMTTFSLHKINSQYFKDFDVLHFHAIYNLTNTKQLLSLADQRRIHITLHDQRFLTGGCHQVSQCTKLDTGCIGCPRVRSPFRNFVREEKRRIDLLIGHKNVRLIFPSLWILKTIEEQKLLTNGDYLYLIRNPIPSSNSEVRFSSQKNSQRFVLGFVAMDLTSPWKGLEDLIRAIQILPKKVTGRMELLLIGEKGIPNLSELGIECRIIRGASEAERNNYYQQMDLLVVPSRQDNSPNVIGEALVNGTKVLGSQVGGIPELLNLMGMKAIDTENTILFAREIEQEVLVSAKQNRREEIATKARQIFGYEQIAKQLLQIYNL